MFDKKSMCHLGLLMPFRFSTRIFKGTPLSTIHGATAISLVTVIALAFFIPFLHSPIAPAADLGEPDTARVLERLHEERMSFVLHAKAAADVVVASEEPARDLSEEDQLVVLLKQAFIQHGVPAELVWVGDVESAFDPHAKSHKGAVGVFQLMPETAEFLGLKTGSDDERTNPELSAQAAARYLAYLHGRFGCWELSLAAYNAGETRVARLLRRHRVASFHAIAAYLPRETRHYVPKVNSLIQLKEEIGLDQLPAPTATDWQS